MIQAICIALMLAGLWSLLALLTLLRQRDRYAGETTRPIFFPRYRRQRQLSAWLVCATVTAPLLCITLASLPGLNNILLAGAAFGLHLFLGTGYVHRRLERLPSYPRSEDPNLHVISLALCWPWWAMGSGR
ncbi:MAG: hypothetical protein WA888_13345 [Burkholderiaceae bacterium]